MPLVRLWRASASIPRAVIDDPIIEAYRLRIDALDHRLLALLAERLSVVHQVGEEKRRKRLPVFDPNREEALLEQLVRDAPPGFDEAAVRAIFSAIVSQCRRLEELKLSEPPGPPAGRPAEF